MTNRLAVSYDIPQIAPYAPKSRLSKYGALSKLIHHVKFDIMTTSSSLAKHVHSLVLFQAPVAHRAIFQFSGICLIIKEERALA